MSNLKKYMKVKKIMLLTMIMQAVMIFPAYADVLADLKKTKLYFDGCISSQCINYGIFDHCEFG